MLPRVAAAAAHVGLVLAVASVIDPCTLTVRPTAGLLHHCLFAPKLATPMIALHAGTLIKQWNLMEQQARSMLARSTLPYVAGDGFLRFLLTNQGCMHATMQGHGRIAPATACHSHSQRSKTKVEMKKMWPPLGYTYVAC